MYPVNLKLIVNKIRKFHWQYYCEMLYIRYFFSLFVKNFTIYGGENYFILNILKYYFRIALEDLTCFDKYNYNFTILL